MDDSENNEFAEPRPRLESFSSQSPPERFYIEPKLLGEDAQPPQILNTDPDFEFSNPTQGHQQNVSSDICDEFCLKRENEEEEDASPFSETSTACPAPFKMEKEQDFDFESEFAVTSRGEGLSFREKPQEGWTQTQRFQNYELLKINFTSQYLYKALENSQIYQMYCENYQSIFDYSKSKPFLQKIQQLSPSKAKYKRDPSFAGI